VSNFSPKDPGLGQYPPPPRGGDFLKRMVPE